MRRWLAEVEKNPQPAQLLKNRQLALDTVGQWPTWLFDHSFANFFAKIVDVILGHQDLDAMHELLGGPGSLREDRARHPRIPGPQMYSCTARRILRGFGCRPHVVLRPL